MLGFLALLPADPGCVVQANFSPPWQQQTMRRIILFTPKTKHDYQDYDATDELAVRARHVELQRWQARRGEGLRVWGSGPRT